jgi:hypothetical protein
MGERNYTEATKSALFALSAKCYFPECKQPSVTFFGNEPEKKVQIAHIHAVSPNGPRYKKMLQEEIDGFRNLILLCEFHHKKVDKKANEHLYPAEELQDWKTVAEKDLRSKFDGLDRLTVDRLEYMLENAARFTKLELDNAIGSLREVSEGAAEILQAMFDKIETHYLDADAVAMLDAASYRLGDLESNAATISSAAYRLGDLESNVTTLNAASHRLENLESQAARLEAAATNLENLQLESMPRWLEDFRMEYNSIINTSRDISAVVNIIEHAGQRVVDQIKHEAAFIDIGEPPNIIDDAQRWKFFFAGVVVAFLLVVIGSVLKATGTI